MAIKRNLIISAWVAIGTLLVFVSSNASQADAISVPLSNTRSPTVEIPGGKFTPLFGLDKNQTFFSVQGFNIDREPVTQEKYSHFLRLKDSQSWKTTTISPLFADSKYLKDWNANKPKRSNLKKPVVYISWYAATAYCEALKGRLPTTLEWEYVAAASETQVNAQKDPLFVKNILAWYAQPSSDFPIKKVGTGKANFYGVKDLHGLIWEWTSDFNSSFITADNRQDGDKIKDLFCGGGSTGAANREDYAAFMRYAMRNSLNANFNVGNLGFRCAYDKK